MVLKLLKTTVLVFMLFPLNLYSAAMQHTPQVYEFKSKQKGQVVMLSNFYRNKVFSEYEGFGWMTSRYFKEGQTVYLIGRDFKSKKNKITKIERFGFELGGARTYLKDEITCKSPCLMSNYEFPDKKWSIGNLNSLEIKKISELFPDSEDTKMKKITIKGRNPTYLIFDRSIPGVYGQGGFHLLDHRFNKISSKEGAEIIPIIDLDNDDYPEFYLQHSDSIGGSLFKMYPNLNDRISHYWTYNNWFRNGKKEDETPNWIRRIYERKDEVLGDLKTLLKSGDKSKKIDTASTILKIYHLEDEATRVIRRLSSDDSPLIRAKVLEGFNTYKIKLPPITIPIIKEGIIDQEAKVRSAAYMAIVHLAYYFKDEMEIFKKEAMKTGKNKNEDILVRRAAIKTIRHFKRNSDKPVNYLLGLLKDPDDSIRLHAASALGYGHFHKNAKKIFSHLERLKKDENEFVSRQAEYSINLLKASLAREEKEK